MTNYTVTPPPHPPAKSQPLLWVEQHRPVGEVDGKGAGGPAVVGHRVELCTVLHSVDAQWWVSIAHARLLLVAEEVGPIMLHLGEHAPPLLPTLGGEGRMKFDELSTPKSPLPLSHMFC